MELPYIGARRILMAAFVALLFGGACSKKEADDPERGRCRDACKQAYQRCRQSCVGDAPLACDADCDRRNTACNEKCETP